ncbi:MAG: hypothetical protein PVH19_14435 [Planctomycetia bacterium]
MTDLSQIAIELDRPDREYMPGDMLAGTYTIRHLEPSEIRAVELSVLWYTIGKGDEDLAVHEFQRRSVDDGDWIDTHPVAFKTKLPPSPLSYEGRIMKIGWCVRVRVFRHKGKDLFAEVPFTFGQVRPARLD